jgi:hypothetical protein
MVTVQNKKYTLYHVRHLLLDEGHDRVVDVAQFGAFLQLRQDLERVSKDLDRLLCSCAIFWGSML